MGAGKSGSLDATRSLFAAQFKPAGDRYIYRRSQTGEAYVVSREERDRFIAEFNRKLVWLLSAFVGGVCALAIGFVVLAPNLPEPVSIGGIVALAVPYSIGFRWAWRAPARQLEGRVPVAGAMSRDDARRFALGRVQYGGLAAAAFGGLVIASTGLVRGDPPRGWLLIWPAMGAALVVFAAVQAFRKWRSGAGSPELATVADFEEAAEEPAEESVDDGVSELKWLRYAIPAALLVAVGWMIFTPGGRRFFEHPDVLPIIMIGLGSWVLYGTVRGLATGRIQLMMRGFSGYYDRDTQSKRFWASFAWNAVMAGFFLIMSAIMLFNPTATATEERCNNQNHKVAAREAYDACTELLDGNLKLAYLSKADVFDSRGYAAEDLNERQQAAADYTRAISADPKDDYAYLNRGRFYLDSAQYDRAIADFSRAHQLLPKSAEALAARGMAYAWKNDRARAQDDFAAVKAIDPKNFVILHGQGVLAMNSGDLESAVADFTESLHRDPRDAWALQMRADAYQQMGDFAKAGADRTAITAMARSSAAR